MTETPSDTLVAVGDVMLDSSLKRDFVSEFGSEDPVILGNLELPLTSSGPPADKPIVFKSSPELAPQLRQAGFSILSVANNHALDYGIEGLSSTLQALRSNSISVIGGGSDLAEALRPRFRKIGGCRVGFQGFSSTLPTGSPATERRPGIAPLRVRSSFVIDGTLNEEQPGTSPYVSTRVEEKDLHQALEAVKDAKRKCDLLILSIHWGVPPEWIAPAQGILAEYQRPLAHKLLEAGVDVIAGHHPHVVQGVEIYKGKPIFYSLGNFLFHAFGEGEEVQYNRPIPYKMENVDNPEVRDSFVVRLRLENTEDRSMVKDISLTPFHLDQDGEPVKSSPDRACGTMERVKRHSKLLGTELQLAENGVGKLPAL